MEGLPDRHRRNQVVGLRADQGTPLCASHGQLGRQIGCGGYPRLHLNSDGGVRNLPRSYGRHGVPEKRLNCDIGAHADLCQAGAVTITKVGFYLTPDDEDGVLGTRDIHLVPGLASPRLDQLLTVSTTTHGGLRSDIPAPDDPWSVSFAPSFTPSPTDPFTKGVRVDPATGEVRVKPPPAGSRLRTFTVTASVRQGATTLTAKLRIHVHGAVVAKWITPSSLTVRQGAKGMRFSVLARFDDGVIGDITNWAAALPKSLPDDRLAVHPDGSANPVHTWSAGSA